MGYAEKWQRLAFREQLLRDIEARLEDPDLSHTQRNRYSVTADKLLHSIAEERVQLYARSSSMMGNPFAESTLWLSMTMATSIRSSECVIPVNEPINKAYD